jgi:hypothetical protein
LRKRKFDGWLWSRSLTYGYCKDLLQSIRWRRRPLGPELVVDPEFESVTGEVTIERAGAVLWAKEIRTGEAEMCQSLENIEHHHFKFESHRRREDIHVHFFGADCLSFGDGIHLAEGDVMQIVFENFGRPLRNHLCLAGSAPSLVGIVSLG